MTSPAPEHAPADTALIREALLKLIIPMGVSLLLVGSINVIDTFYLSLLGDRALSAFSFMLPALFAANQLSIGYGIGVTSVISRARGGGDHAALARLTAHTGVLALSLAALLSLALRASEAALFRVLGASDAERTLIDAFMSYWTPGIGFVVFAAWGTSVLRGFGETRSTAYVMLVQALCNLLLAPLLMFGALSIPALGMGGAGLALTIAAGCSAVLTGWLLWRRRDSIVFSWSIVDLVASARQTFAVALPAILTYTLVPVTTALFTHWLAAFGSDAVAAFGVAARFESFVVMGPLAIGAGLGPYIGHHWGAGRRAELQYATTWCSRVARLWGLGAALVLAACSLPLGRVLAHQPELASRIALALCIVPAGFASYGAIVVAGSVYNNIGQASRTAGFAALRTLALAVPLGALGQLLCGFYGVYAALPLASVITERIAARRLRIDQLCSTASTQLSGVPVGSR
jgi:Na+-driven multidrug efflux pump